MKKVVVLGGGMVGFAMTGDLAKQGFDVTVADVRPEALDRAKSKLGVATLKADLSDPSAVGRLVAPFDMVFGALASVLGYQTLRAVIEAKKSYCDISFMPEDAWELDGLAKQHGVTAVVDCGVGPGMSNMMAGWAARAMSPCERIEIYVGGLPAERRWPYWYKAPFAPSDVLEEYVRPSRIVEHGRIVIKEALSEPELLDFAGVGTLEAFNTDGLRSLAYTLKVPFMKEKTMRWPGHIELMRALRETGFLSKEPVTVGGATVRPLDVTAKLLFPKWTFDEGEADVTVMRVFAEGREHGKRVRRTWDLFDRYDPATNLRSMSRTTAFPAAIVGALIANGVFTEPGVHPPEVLGQTDGLLERVLGELETRGVHYSARVEELAEG